MSNFVRLSSIFRTEKGTVILRFFKDGKTVFEKEYKTYNGAEIAQSKLWLKYVGFEK